MPPRFSIIPGFLACLLISGCAKDSRQSSALDFRVDPTRLGERFEPSDLRMTLRAPAHWNALSDSVVEVAKARLASLDPAAAAGPQILAIYREEADGASLVVSRYGGVLSPASRDSLALLHLQRLKAEHPAGQVEDGRFTYRGFEIVQLRTVDSTVVAFKLLLSRTAEPLVQLDYVVPRSAYPRELESIESSIGSLEPKS